MNTFKKHTFSIKKIIVFIGTIVTILLLFMINYSAVNNRESDSIVQASTPDRPEPIERDYTKIFLPYAETDEEGNLKKFFIINGDEYIPYYNFFSFDEGKKIGFTVGYIKDCQNGCYFNDGTICPEACLNPDNWRPVKTFKGIGSAQYTGVFKGEGYEDTTEFYCTIKVDPVRLDYCSPFKVFETDKDEWVKNEIWLREPYESAIIIVLSK